MMGISNNELMKLFDFILENKKIIIGDNGLFSRDTLTMIRAIVKGKIPNNFKLTPEQEKLMVEVFLNSNNIFDEDTPSFILDNLDCINVAIKRNIYSANFIRNFTPELSQKVLDIAISKKYILSYNSPNFLKDNYGIALNSIRQNSNSANYVNWDSMIKEDYDDLIDETIRAGYQLSSDSCFALVENPDIVLNSIQKNKDTLRWSSAKALNYPKVFKYLISIGHNFSERDLKRKPISSFADYDTMKYVIDKLEIFDKDDEDFTDCFDDEPGDKDKNIAKYIERSIELYSKAIQTVPTINNFNSILKVCAESKWNEHRNTNIDDYANIFGKICIELKNNDNFSKALENLSFMEKIKKTLEEKYNLLIQAMEQYHLIMHSSMMLGNIDYSRDQIAKLTALYVAISKENYKKEKLEEYFEDIKDYFIPKKDHPIILKKLIEHKHKEAFKKMYQNKDAEIYAFIESIVEQYSEIIDKDTIWKMIDNFLINGYSKMDSFIKAPKGWNNYKRLEEASKLINRLNSKYIKYTDLELVKYLDIIKYDFDNDNYYYEGPSFDEESISRYNQYQEKLKIYDKIKQQIIFKAKKLEINDKITEDDLYSIASDLPFNDEYFEFDKDTLDNFDLEDFIGSCIADDDYIEPSSLIDDESYTILIKYAIENGLFWMLFLLDRGADSLYDIEIDKDSILATFDYMKEVVKLSKMFNYDISKYEDILALSELSECADDESIAILGNEVITKLCKYREYTSEDAQEIVKMAKKLVCEMAKRDKSTVPYVSGKTNNYTYSVYDSQDETILLAGINTDACFRIDGNDNDFLHYCALNKNGFVIKITDSFGNFMGRAAGFRNGNGVYINQLRTIYDEGGYGYAGSYVNEKLEIIETFRKACNDIVETSQKNKNEQNKIDFVVVTKSYALTDIESNVGRAVTDKIGSDPMDTESEDWIDFVNNTANLQEISDSTDTFSTDYGNYSLICMAYSKIGNLKVWDIKPKDVEAVYDRPRNKVIVTEKPDITVIKKINKINAINSYNNLTGFKSVSIPKGALTFVGDNWYIIYNNGAIINFCLFNFDNKAKNEFNAVLSVLENQKDYNISQINAEHFVNIMGQSDEIKEKTKIFKIKH